MNLSYTPALIAKTLFYTFIALLIFHISTDVLHSTIQHKYTGHLSDLFNFDREKNIPTLFSSFILGLSSAFLYIIYLDGKSRSETDYTWLFLSLVFLFLCIDETSSIHEKLTNMSRTFFNAKGIFYYAWVIPYLGLALLVFIFTIRLLTNLPVKTSALFIGSGIVFLTGAVGIEMLGGNEASTAGEHTILFFVFITLEESLEMLGIILFIYALTDYITTHKGCLSLTFIAQSSQIRRNQ